MESERFQGENEPRPTPVIELTIDGEDEKLLLNWYNTAIRTYNDSQFNHIEYHLEDGRVAGISCDPELIEKLFEYEFPMYYLPYVDEGTYDWYLRIVNGHLQADIKEFTGEQDEQLVIPEGEEKNNEENG